jgi:serine/threonine-protein kinase PknK
LLLGGSVNQTLSDTVWRFNPMTRKWASLPPMPGPRSEMLAVPCGRVLFVFGGYSGGQAGAPSCMAYDADTEEWSALPSMPTPRQF